MIAFNVSAERAASAFALERGVAIEHFNIIYKLTERLADLLKERAPKRSIETVIGRAKVLKHFSSQKESHLVGARVESGTLRKKAAVRIMRRGELVATGSIETIQHNRQTVDKIENEGEFGTQIESEAAPTPGDILECIVTTIE